VIDRELLEQVRRIQVLSKRLVTDVMSGGYGSVFRGSGIEFDEVREYVDGDDPRAVDWNVTARMGRPYVKKFVEERELTVVFLVDLSASMRGGFAVRSMREAAALLCACLALSAVRNNDKAGLVAFSDRVERYVPAKKGVAHVLRIVRECLGLAPEGRGTDLAAALDFVSRVMRRRSIVFLVSDFLAPLPHDALRLCSRRHDLIAARLLPAELRPRASGLMRWRDPETDRSGRLDWSDARARAAFERRSVELERATTDALRRARVDLMTVDLRELETAATAEVQREQQNRRLAGSIVRFFRMRELRGAHG
jgi:uncharacterized protein (DUF58 family)